MPTSPAPRTPPRVVCTLPTYNESGNILELSRELLALAPDLHVLVVDDDSPDRTWSSWRASRPDRGSP
jgi:glycosyltransferase involved in cell wall biosynthesis